VALGVIAVRGISGLAPSFRLGLSSGFALLGAGLASGVAMIFRGTAMLDEGAADGRWSDPAYAEAGFVKDFHGVTLHGVLVLPALAVLLGRARLTEATRVRVMAAAVGLYVVAAVGVLAWNLSGR
jgi:hypothetical protein